MPTPDQIRIQKDRARPRITELWFALRPLTSVIRFMQSGAHPDDEISGMLAALAFRDGINLSYACSTRGEGGQNDIGTEAGADLGALRTREMERACDVLNMRMYWHCESPDDAITDFGFSKSGEETLDRWGHDRTLARFVEIVRTERPDILCPTFLDVPGQHGHHRAMTKAAHEVMQAAAHPAFASNLPPWQIKKLYLPAWSGAGQAYDDDEPPPNATIAIDGTGTDPVTGWSWERIGQQSRAYHRTQGMGRWMPPGQSRNWPLHLAETHLPGQDTTLSAGLPATLTDLAMVPGAAPIADHLRAAGDAANRAVTAFPDQKVITDAALEALRAVRRAMDRCPDEAQDDILHRLVAKEVQLGHVLRLSLGVEARARSANVFLSPNQNTALTVEVNPGDADAIEIRHDLPKGMTATDDRIIVGTDASLGDPYRSVYDPAAPPAPALEVKIGADGQGIAVRLPYEADPIVLPGRQAKLGPESALINTAKAGRRIALSVSDPVPDDGVVGLEGPDGWAISIHGDGFRIDAPATLSDGLYTLPVTIDGMPAQSVRRIEHPHTAPTARTRPAELRVRAVNAVLPDVRLGYIGAGRDRVGHWLGALGANVTELTDEDIASDGVLAAYDTLVIGIFAMRFRPGLAQAARRLHRWCEAGGTLLTLYHRPWDNWDPDTIPPRRLEIGQPSLRWRVTDENAEVRHLADHPILNSPNQIGPEDWNGWVKERGLYFAKSWDEAYVPLLEMADPGEAPHHGALLVADIGRGRHIHTSLILHHQMENLVPGAFRLMANLIARRR